MTKTITWTGIADTPQTIHLSRVVQRASDGTISSSSINVLVQLQIALSGDPDRKTEEKWVDSLPANILTQLETLRATIMTKIANNYGL